MSAACDALLNQAYQARKENRLADAKRDLIEAVELCRRTGALSELAQALTRLGQIQRDLNQREAALKLYEEAAAIYRANGENLKLAHTVRHLGDIHREQGERVLADRRYREALELYRSDEETTPLELANTLRGFAILKGDMGEVENASALWHEARNLYAAANVEAGVTESSQQLTLLARQAR